MPKQTPHGTLPGLILQAVKEHGPITADAIYALLLAEFPDVKRGSVKESCVQMTKARTKYPVPLIHVCDYTTEATAVGTKPYRRPVYALGPAPDGIDAKSRLALQILREETAARVQMQREAQRQADKASMHAQLAKARGSSVFRQHFGAVKEGSRKLRQEMREAGYTGTFAVTSRAVKGSAPRFATAWVGEAPTAFLAKFTPAKARASS